MPLRVLDPTLEPIHLEAALAPRPSSLQGKRIALFANGKLNAERFLDELGGLLQHRFGVQVHKFNKGNASIVAPKKLVDEMASQCEVAVVAVGD